MNALSPSLRVFAPLTRNSADTLNWLAALFAMPPSVNSIAAHRGGPAAEMLREIAADPKLAPGVALMRETLDQPDDDSAVATRLGRSYGLLFEGIGGPNTVPPYEIGLSRWRGVAAVSGADVRDGGPARRARSVGRYRRGTAR